MTINNVKQARHTKKHTRDYVKPSGRSLQHLTRNKKANTSNSNIYRAKSTQSASTTLRNTYTNTQGRNNVQIILDIKSTRCLSVDEVHRIMKLLYEINCLETITYTEDGKIIFENWKLDR